MGEYGTPNIDIEEGWINIKQNKIGKLLYLRGIYGHGGKKNYKKEWRGIKRKSGGGQLVDQGIHLIDLSRYFLGNLKPYNKHLDTIYWNTKVEDNVFLTLKKRKKNSFSSRILDRMEKQILFRNIWEKGQN